MINDTVGEPIVNDDDMIDIYDELVNSNSEIDLDIPHPIDHEFTHEFDFTPNGGEYLSQNYVDKEGKNEQVS